MHELTLHYLHDIQSTLASIQGAGLEDTAQGRGR